MNSRASSNSSPVNIADWEKVPSSNDFDNDEKNSSSWIDVLNNGDFLRRVISKPGDDLKDFEVPNNNGEGSSGNSPQVKKFDDNDNSNKPACKMGDKVKIKVSGRLVTNNTTNFDNELLLQEDNSSKIDENDELEFVIGLSDVISAFEMVVQFMAVNEIDEIKVKSRFAYGDIGREPDIPPKSTLHYTVQLLSVENGPDVYNMDVNERMDYCEKRKDRGNYYFKRGEYDKAAEIYTKGIDATNVLLDENDLLPEEDRIKFNSIRVALYNNISAAHLKSENWDLAIEATEKCLKIEPSNAKSLYRGAKAHQAKHEYEKALKFYEQILKSGHDIKDVKEEIAKCKNGLKTEKLRQKKLYGKMMGSSQDEKEGCCKSTFTTKRGIGMAALVGGAALGAALALRFISK